jgi:hypothetical protein
VPVSPKSHKYDVIEPVDWSVNWTDNGELPEVGVAVKFATGATGGVLTEI